MGKTLKVSSERMINMEFMDYLKNNEKAKTKKGATCYKTTGHAIVDLFFKVPSYRKNVIDYSVFDKSFTEDAKLTTKFLLFLRDIRNGMGERDTFRKFMLFVTKTYPEFAKKFFDKIDVSEYGRWDDLVYIYCNSQEKEVNDIIITRIKNQLKADIYNYQNDNSCSLLAKWLPSINTSSKNTVNMGHKIRKALDLSCSQYRKILSVLREYLKVVEVDITKNNWDKIDYSAVPSCANLKYKDAFYRHDAERRLEYLSDVKHGKEKINSNSMFLHDIINKYSRCIYSYYYAEDDTLEQLWKSQKKPKNFKDTLVVRDGSGSMLSSTNGVAPLDIADAISLYCAENNTGAFKNEIMTFSSHPRIVTVDCGSLCKNLKKLRHFDDYDTTNVEGVFNLLLNTALKNNLKQEDLPHNVLIISDLQFDSATHEDSYDDTLFEQIEKEWQKHGYSLPKLIFWNVAGEQNVIPVQEMNNGLILLSGFSKNIVDMISEDNFDSYKSVCSVLNVPRYSCVDKLFEQTT